MAKGEIVSIRDVAGDFTRPTQITHKEVQYRIDGAGPFVVTIPMGEFTPGHAIELIGQKVKEWADTVGKTVERS